MKRILVENMPDAQKTQVVSKIHFNRIMQSENLIKTLKLNY